MRSNIRLLFILALILFSSAIFGQEKVAVKVYPEIKRQKIQSVGGNYCQTRLTNSACDAIGEQTLKEFKPGFVRVALPLQFRRDDYANYKGNRIVEQPLVISLLESMKRMKTEFGVKSFTVSVWNVANELVVDPTKREQRVIKPGSYDEVLDMLVAFFLKAKNDYGVEADYFSFNESDGGWQVQFSPQATIAFIKKAMVRFGAAGIKTKFLLADTAQTKGTVEFATMIMSDSTIWKALGPLCFHSCWPEKIPDSAFEVSMYWTWQNDYSIMSPDLKTLYPSYYMTRHLIDYLNTGTQIVHSTSSDPDVLAIGGIHEKGNQVIQLINMKKVPVTVDIDGYNSKSVDMVSTTESSNWNIQKNVTKSKKGLTSIQLLPESVNTDSGNN